MNTQKTARPNARQCRGGPCARPSPVAMGAGDHKGRPCKTGYSKALHFSGGFVLNRQQLADELKEKSAHQSAEGDVSIHQQVVDDLKDEIISYIPQGHHMPQPDARQCRGGSCARPSPVAMAAGDHKGRPYKTGYSGALHLAAHTTPVEARFIAPAAAAFARRVNAGGRDESRPYEGRGRAAHSMDTQQQERAA